ncbi:uncharacterized protein VTP21DRAFT_7688 [Calcarisporiella thermophila]|uniref:uncharacterized protein n=1 Tax=Calcarisporiella thermophila TaxID=911321 RepID=UPI003743235A
MSTTKIKEDLSPAVDAAMPQAEELARQNKLSEAIEKLLVIEKKARQAEDLASTSRILVGIIRLCFEAQEWQLLNENIVLLSKKHGQLKQAVTKMVQEAMTYIDRTPDEPTKLELIDTLRTVTEGKMYVEVERARLTRMLAKIREEEGKIAEAADILQELQVETFGSMEKREKTDFILEQMRLTLAKKDYTRMQIISKKINTKFFAVTENQDLKLRYYELMIYYALHENQYLNACKYYREVYNTPSVLDDEEKWKEILQNVVLFVVLSPFDNEQHDLIHRIYEDERLSALPLHYELVKCFITSELMRWPRIEEIYAESLRQSYVFGVGDEGGERRWQELRDRVIEHNIRVVAKYYDRITTKRLTQLLDLTPDATEAFLSKLVVSKTIYARIDRLDGVITFTTPKDPNDALNEWSDNINTLLGLIEKTCHLITKEEMVSLISS